MPVTLLMFAASAVLLGFIHPPVGIWILAWVGYVPFIIASLREDKFWRTGLWAWIIGSVYWLCSLSFVAPVTIWGWVLFCLYSGVLWVLLAYGFRVARRYNVPLFLAAGIIIVAVENLQGFLLGSFYWRWLAHSQYSNILLIQLTDIFGASGVSFLVAMSSGLVAEFVLVLTSKKRLLLKHAAHAAVFLVLVTAALLYGKYRVDEFKNCVEQGPMVAAIQTNVPQSVKIESSQESVEQIFNDMITMSSQAFDAGAKMTVWPETMVQAILDKRVLALIGRDNYHAVFNRRLLEHVRDRGYVLAGASGAEPELKEDFSIELKRRYNSAFLYTPFAEQACQYDKIHLVPFGEVVPFKRTVPWLYDFMMVFTPYDYDYSLDEGQEFTIFNMNCDDDEAWRFGVMICYEDVVPGIARSFALNEQGKKQVDWLLNISNDGWFIQGDGEQRRVTSELAEHLAVCVFRAVENRVSILRSVNTGISCLIDSAGRIKDGYQNSSPNFPEIAMDRTVVQGWFMDKVGVDRRITIYSRYGRILAYCSLIVFFGLLFSRPIALFKNRLIKRGTEKK